MDDSTELVDRLCTLAGMILEDASAEAILTGKRDKLQLKVERMRRAGADVAILADAAAVILGRSGEEPR